MITTLVDVALTDITANPANPRLNVGDVTELTDSIKALGILEPLIVAENTDGTYVLIAGHRRHAAATAAGLTQVPCLLRGDLDTPAKQIEAMLVENVQRSDLTVVEEGRAYQALLEFPGYTQKKIAKATGRSAATVKGRIALTKLPAKTTARIDAGEITIHDAEKLIPFIDDKDVYKRLSGALGTNNFGYELARAQRNRKAKAEFEKEIAELTAAGITITTQPALKDREDAVRIGSWQSRHIDADTHQDCPHHVVWTDTDRSGVPIWAAWCIDPSVHPKPVDEDDQDDDEPDEESTGPVKFGPDNVMLQAAFDARCTWLRENVYGPAVTPDTATLIALMRRTAQQLLDEYTQGENAIGLAVDSVEDAAATDTAIDGIRAEITSPGISLARLVQLVAAMDGDPSGPGTGYAWRGATDRSAYDLAIELGYQPSDVEIEAYTYYAPEPVETEQA